jgi:hypothetical protein
MNDTERGLYGKYRVERTDGSSEPGRKHHNCWYFVLDVRHDKHAVAALKAYIESCRTEYPELAADLEKAIEHKDCSGSPYFDGHSH